MSGGWATSLEAKTPNRSEVRTRELAPLTRPSGGWGSDSTSFLVVLGRPKRRAGPLLRVARDSGPCPVVSYLCLRLREYRESLRAETFLGQTEVEGLKA